MTSGASAQLPDAPAEEPLQAVSDGRDRRGRQSRWPWRQVRRGAWLLFFASWIGLGAWHVTKPLPRGMHVASPWEAVPSDSVRLLADLTTADGFGQPVLHQEIFDETLRVIARARRFVVLDQFLFNELRGAAAEAGGQTRGAAPMRALSRELEVALIEARRNRPALRILFLTDPINDVYGGAPSASLARLQAAGVEVVRTDLDQLRDSNPLWSGFWRLTMHWWDGDARGTGWLPNPLESGPSRVTFRAWARLLNFKANHRKVVIADDGSAAATLVGIVGSANPHDASSAHSNLAFELRGAALLPLLRSEMAVARFSGWRGEPLPEASPAAAPVMTSASPSLKSLTAASAAAAASPTSRVRVLTEGAIRDEVLERLAQSGAGDAIDIAMFYLAEREIIEALLAAADRGAEVRLLLDPNKDAFGRQKNGIPNRPVASELVSRSDGTIRVRWYRTHGEQFHTKLIAIRHADRLWLTAGSANLTRRNVGDFNLEANLSVDVPSASALAQQVQRYFETLWNNRAPAGIEYTADFGTFADPAQSSYWAYRLMEATGLSTF